MERSTYPAIKLNLWTSLLAKCHISLIVKISHGKFTGNKRCTSDLVCEFFGDILITSPRGNTIWSKKKKDPVTKYKSAIYAQNIQKRMLQ